MQRLLMFLACAALAASGGTTLAADRTVPEVPNQPWYPAGYLDLRIASEGEVASFPRDDQVMVWSDFDNPKLQTYDLIDCNLGADLPPDLSERDGALALLALDIARMRSEFARLGYKREVYEQPLLDYERVSLEAIAVGGPSEYAPEFSDPEDSEFTEDEAADAPLTDAAVDAATDDEPYVEPETDLTRLRDAIEAQRRRLQPGKPEIVIEGGCGAGEVEFTIRMLPASGELWLINAFAFRVCERKVAKPWDHSACGWTQYLGGDSTFASGRYMYEARWGSKFQRGARVLQGDLEENEGGVITFRRN